MTARIVDRAIAVIVTDHVHDIRQSFKELTTSRDLETMAYRAIEAQS
jgi:hypothetical protein